MKNPENELKLVRSSIKRLIINSKIQTIWSHVHVRIVLYSITYPRRIYIGKRIKYIVLLEDPPVEVVLLELKELPGCDVIRKS